MDYHPDVWVIIELTGTGVREGKYYRVLAGWYGGFAGSDGWKASSGIVAIKDHDTHWEIENTSGSLYYCHKNTERLSGYTTSILNKFMQGNSPELFIRQVPIKEVDLAAKC